MNFGKREQLVALGVSGIITIGAMHLLVFSPRASQLSELITQVEQAQTEVTSYKKVEPPTKVRELATMNTELETLYDSAVTSLGLSVDPIFNVPSFATTVVSEEETKGKDDAQIELVRRGKLKAERDRVFEAQTDLVVKEIERLRAFGVKAEGAKTEMSFLADRPGGWRLPTALPAAVQGSKLIDILIEAKDTLSIVGNINPAQRPTLYAEQRAYYEGLMLQIGINKNLYRDPTPNGLLASGEFVPILHSIAVGMLVEDQIKQQLGDERQISGQTTLDRKTIFDILEIRLPFGVMVNALGEDLQISEMYFIYEQLKWLNELLDLAAKVGIAEIFGVRFEESGYLVEAPIAFANPETTATPVPTPANPSLYVLPTPWPADPTPMALGEVHKGAVASERGATDVGYCLPIVMQYRTSNQAGMKFIFEVTRQFLMSEVDSIRVLSQPDRTDSENIWFEVRFLGVPYIFSLQETPVPTPTPAPGAVPPAAAAANAALPADYPE